MAEVAQPAFPNRQHQVIAGVDGRIPILLACDEVHAPFVEASDEFLYILSEIPGLTHRHGSVCGIRRKSTAGSSCSAKVADPSRSDSVS